MFSIGLLIIRVVVGLTLMGHASQKLFGWFGGGGLKATGQGFESMGFKPGATMALLAGLSEFVGGGLFALGLLTPLASLLIFIPMAVATLKVHLPNGFWSSNGGVEYNLVIMAAAVGVAFTGAGNIAIDALIF